MDCDAVMNYNCALQQPLLLLKTVRKNSPPHYTKLFPFSCQCVRLHLNSHASQTDQLHPPQHYSPQQVISHPATAAHLLPHNYTNKAECLPPRLASLSSRAPSRPPLVSSSAASRRLSCLPCWTSSLVGPRLPSCSSGRTMRSSATPSPSQRAGRSSSLNGYVVL